ncbi:MAG TPA: hypothetical protein VGT44_17080 [Ktedonobacteraceae bacterium]|nr:hypothetical protein [Ktedonobacteraceae bacterium]
MHQLMSVTLADVLAPWGQAAATVLAIFLFVNILVGLALTAAFAFLFAWVREKAELIKKLRPTVDMVNKAMAAPESVVPTGKTQERLAQAVQRVQAFEVSKKLEQARQRTQSISAQVEQRADRVAETMIEIRARTVMVKGMAKAFFLPGLVERPRLTTRARVLLPEVVEMPAGGDGLAVEPASAARDERQLVEIGNERLH